MTRMQPFLSPAGSVALRFVMQRQPLLGFDFDGTLAPIVTRPGDAKVSTALARRIARLCTLLPVAVVSGRSVADLQQRLPFRPRWIVGNHGAELPARAPDPQYVQALDPLRDRLRAHARDIAEAGIAVEDKGLSIALHYRCAPVLDRALMVLQPLLRQPLEGTRIVGGKRVVNVTAAGAPDKGEAMAALVRDCGASCALYIGDDANDESVFRRAPPHWLTVRVGRDDAHSAASWYVDSEADVAMILESMLHCLETQDE